MGYRRALRWWGSSSSRRRHCMCLGASRSTCPISEHMVEQHIWSLVHQPLPKGTWQWTCCILNSVSRGEKTVFTEEPQACTSCWEIPCWVAFAPGPFDEVWQVVKQIEGVEGVTCDLSDCPHHQKQDHTFLILNLSDTTRDKPNHEYPRAHLDPSHDHRCPNNSNCTVPNLQQSKCLEKLKCSCYTSVQALMCAFLEIEPNHCNSQHQPPGRHGDVVECEPCDGDGAFCPLFLVVGFFLLHRSVLLARRHGTTGWGERGQECDRLTNRA